MCRAVYHLCLLLVLPWVGLWFVILAFPVFCSCCFYDMFIAFVNVHRLLYVHSNDCEVQLFYIDANTYEVCSVSNQVAS